MENLKIYNLYQLLISDIANAELSPGIVYFILKDILQEVEQTYQQIIIHEQTQQKDNEDK